MKKKLLYIFITILFTLTITSGCRLRLDGNGSSGGGNNNGGGNQTIKGRAKTIEEMFEIISEAVINEDLDMFMNVAPDFVGQQEKNKFKDYIRDSISSMKEEYGQIKSMDFEIKEKEKLSQELIDEANKNIKEKYNYNSEISEAYKVLAKIHIVGSIKSKTIDDDHYYFAVKIDGYWYYDF